MIHNHTHRRIRSKWTARWNVWLRYKGSSCDRSNFQNPLTFEVLSRLVLFGNCSLFFLLLILLLFFFFVFCRCWCTRYSMLLFLLLLLQCDISLVYWRYIWSHFLVYGLLRNCRFSLLLISMLLLVHCDYYPAKSYMATIIFAFASLPLIIRTCWITENNIIFHYL